MNLGLMLESLPALLWGTVVTLQLLALALAVGLAIAVPAAVLGLQGPAAVRWSIAAYTYVFRGTPMLVQIFLLYYGLAQFEIVRDSVVWLYLRQPWICAVLTFSLNTGAYTTYILRSAITAVPAGEVEAARACGMSTATAYRTIVLPYAARLALPAYTNEVVSMLKSTSLASTITILDLTGVANTIVARTFAPYELFVTAALIYLAITFGLTTLLGLAERRSTRHLRPLAASTGTPSNAGA